MGRFAILIGVVMLAMGFRMASDSEWLTVLTGGSSKVWVVNQNYLNGYRLKDTISDCRVGNSIAFSSNGLYRIHSLCDSSVNQLGWMTYTVSGTKLGIMNNMWDVLQISDTALWLQLNYTAPIMDTIGAYRTPFEFTVKYIPQ